MIKKLLKRIFAFNMLEVTISLVTIGLITSSFMPIITKHIAHSSIAIRQGNQVMTDCNGVVTANGTTLDSSCKLCYPEKCIKCNKVCLDDEYKVESECKCLKCKDLTSVGDTKEEREACLRCGDGSKCTRCKGGYYLDVTNGKCKICPEGAYCREGDVCPNTCREYQWTTTIDKLGTNDGKGKMGCAFGCPKGKYCHTENKVGVCPKQPKIEDCLCGNYCQYGKEMTKCPNGYYQNEKGKDSCKSCTPGKWSSDTGRCSDCTESCEKGYYCINGIKTPCPRGYYCPTGSSAPTPCPKGYYCPNDKMSTPTVCGTGKYQQSEGQTSCYDCIRGSYCPNSVNINPTPCPKGNRCPDTKMTAPVQCDAGTYQPSTGQQSCNSCTAGFKCPNRGMENPTPCPAGQYQGSSGKTDCITCAAGTYSTGSSSGTTACTCCAAGKWSAAGRTSACTDNCPAGKYCTGTGNCQQINCPCGYYSTAGSSKCTACGGGQYSGAGAGSCTNCPAGKSCTSCAVGSNCPAGQYSPNNDRSCHSCGAGTYSSAGAGSCSACPKGQYQNESGKSSCKACPTGNYCPNTGMSGYWACPKGQYQNSTGQSGCISCPAGQYCPNTGMSGGWNCAAGTYSTGGATGCTGCPAGTFQGSAGASKCDSCGTGTYSTGSATSCSSCPPGQYQNSTGQSGCIPCGAGTYSSTWGSIACANCTNWHAQCASCNASGCTACASGYKVSGTGCVANSCIFRLREYVNMVGINNVGDYSHHPGSYDIPLLLINSTAIFYAPHDTRILIYKVDNNLKCADSTRMDRGITKNLGKHIYKNVYTFEADANGYCIIKSGTHSNEYTDSLYGDFCWNGFGCKPGHYRANGIYSANCVPCPPGTFAAGIEEFTFSLFPSHLRTTCTVCPDGKYTSSEGQTSCASCPTGYTVNANHTGCVVVCSAGKYRSGSSCVQCPDGKYQPYNNYTETYCQNCPSNYRSNDDRSGCVLGIPSIKSGVYCYNVSSCGAECESAINAVRCDNCSSDVISKCPVGCWSKSGGDCAVYGSSYKRPVCFLSNCPKGTLVNSGDCAICPSNQYSTTVNSSSCKACIGVVNADHTECTCPNFGGVQGCYTGTGKNCSKCCSGYRLYQKYHCIKE